MNPTTPGAPPSPAGGIPGQPNCPPGQQPQQPQPPYCPPGQQQYQQVPFPYPLYYRRPLTGWMVFLWVIVSILGILLVVPLLKVGLYAFGGSCSAVIGVAVVILATWKLIDLLILGFRKLFPPPPPAVPMAPGYQYPPQM